MRISEGVHLNKVVFSALNGVQDVVGREAERNRPEIRVQKYASENGVLVRSLVIDLADILCVVVVRGAAVRDLPAWIIAFREAAGDSHCSFAEQRGTDSVVHER